MPELPEVEVTRRSVAARLRGATILSVAMGKPLRWPLGCEPQALAGMRIEELDRRGKYLLLMLNQGVLLVHLGMSGSLQLTDLVGPGAASPLGVHDHFELKTSFGVLRLHDPRRFGAVVFAGSLSDPVARKLLDRLGPEPLGPDFTAPQMFAAMKPHRVAIKQVLLAGRAVVGVGNIYASEVLFLARVRPTRAANLLTKPESVRLHAAIQQTLARAIDMGGTTLRDFHDASGSAGLFQNHTKVYGREGQPCDVCKNPVRMIRQGQRSTFFCSVCQAR